MESTLASAPKLRIESIDIFRGLTVLVMIFVDNLDFVQGLPWWTYHAARDLNYMTYVDMVFPAFLFIMGASLPLAVERRTAKGDSPAKIWMHILIRSLSMVVLGLFISNGSQVNAQSTHLSEASWDLLGFVAIALLWGVYPVAEANRRLARFLKYAGLLLLASLVILFRRTNQDGHIAWLDFSDWEILGLLGWAYLFVGSIYLIFRKNIWALAVPLAALVTINVLSVSGWFSRLGRFSNYMQPFEAGLSSITIAGLIAGLIVLSNTESASFRRKTLLALGYAAILAGAAWILTPLGISKLRDTPTWCLYCAAANTVILLLLYWLADVKRWSGWSGLFEDVGANALLAYLLAYVAYFNSTLFHLTSYGTMGWIGVMRSLMFAGLVCAMTVVLTRLGFKLRL